MVLAQASSIDIELSIIQQDVWAELKAWPDTAHLNLGGYTRVEGVVDVALLQRALLEITQDNDALRLWPKQDGQQTLLTHVDYPLEIVDYRGQENAEQKAKQWQQQWMQQRFSNALPPNRFALLRVSAKLQYIVVQCCHIVMDGWSTSLIIQKWSQAYNRLKLEQPLAQSEPSAQSKSYQDFIIESADYRSSKKYQKDQAFWQNALPNLPEPLFGPRYLSSNKSAIAHSHFQTSSLPRMFLQRLALFCHELEVSQFHFFIAMLAVYLSRSQGRNEIVIGVPSLNRSGGKYKNTLGMFVNILPINIKIDDELVFVELLRQVKQGLTQAYRYAKYPIGDHYKRLQALELGQERIFDVLLSYENFDFVSYYGDALIKSTKQTFSGETRYPLAITITDFEKDLDGEMIIEGSERYFTAEQVQWLSKRLIFLSEQLLKPVNKPCAELAILPEQERQDIKRISGIDAVTEQVQQPTFLTSIYQQVLQNQHAIAVVWDEQQWSYLTLWQKVTALSQQLMAKGIKAQDVVAFKLAKGPNSLLAILAINHIGATFLALDSALPKQRLANILLDANVKLLLVAIEDKSTQVDPASTQVFYLDSLALEGKKLLPPGIMQSSDISYILYTSGTSGVGKGVKVSANALTERLRWLQTNWQISSDDVALQITQHHFDPALIELLTPLCAGARVAFVPAGILQAELISDYIAQFSATFMAFVPITLSRFLATCEPSKISSLRVCCCGGEVLSRQLVTEFYQKTKATLYNVYGPTEACIFATAWQTKPDHHYLQLPLGKSLSGTRIYILNAQLQPLPMACVGEIYIAGSGLAQGYVNAKMEDRQRFSQDPFVPSETMYKTGDQGWIDQDGNLHFSGRNDRQIKLRGYRIELDEIEQSLLMLNSVDEAAVKLIEQRDQAYLVAWFVASCELSADLVRQQLAAKLPSYMLPRQFIQLTKLPLTASGKVNFHALNCDDVSAMSLSTSTTAPNEHAQVAITELEANMLQVWRQVFKRRLQVEDNFFDLGGDSLTAAILLSEIEYKLGCKLSLQSVIENPNVRLLSALVSKQASIPKLLVSLEHAGTGPNLYIAASGHNDIVRFQSLAKAMKGVCNLHMLQPPEQTETWSIEQLAKAYAEVIAKQGNNQLYIAGFSIGGLAALETARALIQRGKTVEHLFIVDTILLTPPKWLTRWWLRLQQFSQRHPRLARFVMTRKFRTLVNDQGLYMQVNAMAQHNLKAVNLQVSLLKSNSFAYWAPLVAKRWHRLFGSQLREYKIATHHSGFFEADKVSELAKIIQQQLKP